MLFLFMLVMFPKLGFRCATIVTSYKMAGFARFRRRPSQSLNNRFWDIPI